MEFADLYVFPEKHPPSPYNHPVTIMIGDRFGDGYLPEGLSLYAIGWLEQEGFTVGQTPDACINTLFNEHTDHIIRDGTRGLHTCTLCEKSMPHVQWKDRVVKLIGHGHYLVQMNDAVFMAPELILHYILDHKYCPPQEFVQATINGKFLYVNNLVVHWRS